MDSNVSMQGNTYKPCDINRFEYKCGSLKKCVYASVVTLKMRCHLCSVLQVTVVFCILVTAIVMLKRDTFTNVVEELQLSKEESHHSIQVSEAEVTRKRSKKLGYILTLDYTGQQIAGVRGLLSQQCWVGAFNLPMVIVEPFINDSHLIHSSAIWRNISKTQRFSDYFNLMEFNKVSRQDKNPQLVKWEGFLQNAPRKVITVTIDDLFNRECLQYKETKCAPRTVDQDAVHRFTLGCSRLSRMDNALQLLKANGFRHIKSVCLNCQDSMPPELYFTPEVVMRYIFGHYDPSEVTLLISQWKFSIKMTPKCLPSSSCKDYSAELLAQRLRPSLTLQIHSNKYLSSYYGTQINRPTIAIMIRLEWYLIMQRDHILDTVDTCLQRVLQTFKNLTKTRFQKAQPFLALDVGKYGSDTYNSTLHRQNLSSDYYNGLMERIKSTVSELHQGQLTFTQWEDTFESAYSEVKDRGFIAALQSTIASKADCLILMGGGHFQQMALQYYIEQHPTTTERCIEHLCMPKSFERLTIRKIDS